jgi:archaellum component FlaC
MFEKSKIRALEKRIEDLEKTLEEMSDSLNMVLASHKNAIEVSMDANKVLIDALIKHGFLVSMEEPKEPEYIN